MHRAHKFVLIESAPLQPNILRRRSRSVWGRHSIHDPSRFLRGCRNFAHGFLKPLHRQSLQASCTEANRKERVMHVGVPE
ncbi:hypothetical protein M3A49_38160 [Paraburkholderia sp. CNPSo 3076]|uniref:hypothetical protein n=1 Tax=Paraburkholderia sp. CNPSo 3076 TaxID=2940936 RepID=UPI00225212FE|nr:hypothetical protein [Paraburkholderia sp. CNPSo 3076]MCX5545204.1 hypothetical protein [Paraburkholderia sp. CNPSo 3076]